MSEISSVISRLERQRQSIERAIAALREVDESAPAAKATKAAVGRPRKKNRLSEAGRRRIAEAAKRYWAQKRAEKSAAAKKGR
jgi:hypothetical protein